MSIQRNSFQKNGHQAPWSLNLIFVFWQKACSKKSEKHFQKLHELSEDHFLKLLWDPS